MTVYSLALVFLSFTAMCLSVGFSLFFLWFAELLGHENGHLSLVLKNFHLLSHQMLVSPLPSILSLPFMTFNLHCIFLPVPLSLLDGLFSKFVIQLPNFYSTFFNLVFNCLLSFSFQLLWFSFLQVLFGSFLNIPGQSLFS